MARRPNTEIASLRYRFKELMKDFEFRQMTQHQQAQVLEVSQPTVAVWLQEVKPEQWQEWLVEDNKQIAKKEIKVDDTLFRQAMTGDVAAIKLWYQKKGGWSEKQISEHTVRNGDLERVPEEELLKHFKKDALEKALKAQELTVIPVVPEVKVDGSNG